MDFAAALNNLQKTAKNAAAASSSTSNSNSSSHDRRRGRSDSYRPDPPRTRPRYEAPLSRDVRKGDTGERGRGRRNDQNPMDALYRFGYRMAPYQRPSQEPPNLYQRPFHVALLAIIIDEIPYEEIWRTWAQTGASHVSMLCHAKYPERVQSGFVKSRLLTKPPIMGRGHSYAEPEYLTHTPAWGSVQITRAMIDLLKAGMHIATVNDTETDPRFATKRFLMTKKKDVDTSNTIPPIDKFIFVSETCIPVATLEECETALFGAAQQPEETMNSASEMKTVSSTSTLMGNSKPIPKTWKVSWLNARHRSEEETPRNKYEDDQFGGITRNIPGQYRWKADQWLCLSRPHAAAVLRVDANMRASDQLWNAFAKINASDEMYFPTVLALLGILRPRDESGINHSSTEVWVRPITFTDWSEGMRNPTSYHEGMKDLSRIGKLARSQGSLFARKFVPIGPGKTSPTGHLQAADWLSFIKTLSPFTNWDEDNKRAATSVTSTPTEVNSNTSYVERAQDLQDPTLE